MLPLFGLLPSRPLHTFRCWSRSTDRPHAVGRSGAPATTRSGALPDVPTVSDFVPGYEASFWSGVGAPKNTPVEIVDTLNKEINAALADPKMKARFAELGATDPR
jgi:tripartite-type tricarboxylate transporter receptor subunit TctC